MLSNNPYNKIAQFRKINKIKLSLLKLLKIRPRLSKRNNHRLFAIRKLTDSNLQQLSKRTKPKSQHRLKKKLKIHNKMKLNNNHNSSRKQRSTTMSNTRIKNLGVSSGLAISTLSPKVYSKIWSSKFINKLYKKSK